MQASVLMFLGIEKTSSSAEDQGSGTEEVVRREMRTASAETIAIARRH